MTPEEQAAAIATFEAIEPKRCHASAQISVDVLCSMLKAGKGFTSDLPKDAAIVCIGRMSVNNTVRVTFASQSFKELVECEEPPLFQILFNSTERQSDRPA